MMFISPVYKKVRGQVRHLFIIMHLDVITRHFRDTGATWIMLRGLS